MPHLARKRVHVDHTEEFQIGCQRNEIGLSTEVYLQWIRYPRHNRRKMQASQTELLWAQGEAGWESVSGAKI